MSDIPGQRYWWLTYLSLATACVFVAFALWFVPRLKWKAACRPHPDIASPVSLNTVDQVVTASDEPLHIDLVTFQPAFSEHAQHRLSGRPKARTFIPNTYVSRSLKHDDDLERLTVDGEFALVRRLYRGESDGCSLSQRSGWSYVRQTCIVSLAWCGDATYRRLRALEAAGKYQGTHYLLAICPEDSNAALDATFIGPLSRSERIGLADFIELARSAKSAPITLEYAERLLESKSPWLAWFGLHRLKQLDCLSAHHFARALKSRDVTAIADAVGEMISSSNQTQSRPLTAELLFPALDPARRKQALAAARSFYRDGLHGARTSIRLADWQAAASAHRKDLLGDPANASIVNELDLILALKK